MAASWCHLRFWYMNSGEKLYKSSDRLLCRRQTVRRCLVLRITSSTAVQKDAFQKVEYNFPTKKGHKKDTSSALPAAYSPQYVEAAWYDWWVNKGFFLPHPAQAGSKQREPFVMLLPPPNVTGTLHLGHALTCSIQDALARWHRMKGQTTLWIPGTDHAGIAMQAVVEKLLWSQEQQTRQQLGRHGFHQRVTEWREEKGHVIEEQMKALGSSFDWSRNFFTLDEGLSGAVTEAFVRLYDKGKVYRDSRLVHWSCSLQSTISDIEVENVLVEGRTRRHVPGYQAPVEFGFLSSFAYPVLDSQEEVVVSTTRLETMLGDVAVAVHPDDSRYSHLIGRHLQHPLCQRLLPVIADNFVDRAFGSGAVKITPGHDPIDFEVGRRYKLAALNILDDEGKICGDVPDDFVGVPRFVAREAVRQALIDLGLYRGEVSHSMALPVCSRSGDVVEARMKEQWFLNCKEMALRAIEVAEREELTFSAPHHAAVWYEWLHNIKDWCLSRQLWWGHRIPAYRLQTSGGEQWIVARCQTETVDRFHRQHPHLQCHSLSQDEDVLDTWFSSALLPFSVFGWPGKTEDLGRYYPLSMMETGQDILFFWVARMVMLGLELTDQLPFNHVLLHGIVRDAHGRKMSKSLGNVIDPMDIITGASLQELHDQLDSGRLSQQELQTARDGQRKDFPHGIPECGADALRFTLCSYDFKADSIPMDILHSRTHRLFCNKIWQSFRFTQQHLHPAFTPLSHYALSGKESAVDLWLLSRLSELVQLCDKAFTSSSLQGATKALHHFWLNDFCDVYLECSKPVLWSQDLQQKEVVCQILYHTTYTFLRALSPFMPFLTEELFQRLPGKETEWPESVCITSFPLPVEFPWRNEELEEEMRQVLDICQRVLSVRHEYSITKVALPVFIVVDNTFKQASVLKLATVIEKLCKAESVTVLTDISSDCSLPAGCASIPVNAACQVHVQLKDYADLSTELQRLSQKRDILVQQQQDITVRLADLVKRGKGQGPAAQKLQAKERSLTAQLKVISNNMESVARIHNS